MVDPNNAETVDTTVGVPEDYAAFERYRETGELPEAADDQSSAGDQPDEEEAPESAGDDEDSPENEEEQEDEQPKPEPKKKGGWQRKIDRLERTNAAMAARLAEIESGRVAEKPAEARQADKPANGAPKPEDFQNYDEYLDARADWRFEQKQAEQAQKAEEVRQREAQQTAAESWVKNEKAVKDANADYDEVLDSVEDVVFAKEFQTALFESEQGPALAYEVAKNRAEAERIAKLSPGKQLIELGKIEARLANAQAPAPKPATPKTSKAPAPLKPVSKPAAKAVTRIEDASDYSEFERLREKQLRS